VRGTDGLSAHGDAELDLAQVHRHRGDAAAAHESALRAREAYARKGHRVGVAAVETILADRS